jgi:hypothetical protein
MTMPVTHDTNERQQAAIWPWILMPLVVLLVAFTLYRFKDAAERAAQAQPHAAATSETTEP